MGVYFQRMVMILIGEFVGCRDIETEVEMCLVVKRRWLETADFKCCKMPLWLALPRFVDLT